MTKSELIDALATKSSLTKARAELVVNCVFDTMTESLQRGEGIEIRGFGSFSVRHYEAYSGRNPRTESRSRYRPSGSHFSRSAKNSRYSSIKAVRTVQSAADLTLTS